MKKTVQAAMLLGVITLSMVSCDKDDNQLQMKKEVKANGVDQEMDNNDLGNTTIKPPIRKVMNEQEDNNDLGNTTIKPPKNAKNTNEQVDNNDLGNTTIKPPIKK
ncbi:hypothetical protein HX049_01385 [Myroides odoratimimus]|uniref:hypothetical protein n=2 Tax=Myroides odoratimimus TaxID=76832 RepID=UPI002577B9B2|nr:hypothetical protein [Myroides odoratimimus]MDM1395839.1 hypothetical protein [Myroides odoratimimus]